MTVREPQYSWFSFLSSGVVVDRMRVEAVATLESSASDDGAIGVGCFATELTGYLASVWPDGYFAIGVDPSSSEEIACSRTARPSRRFRGPDTRTRSRSSASAGRLHF